ncbi:ORF6N domain-containing protein [Deltaproteobacteria bacterium]|nr:ORF6N domain-containing protein [Deltaproteobacteria bacterium]
MVNIKMTEKRRQGVVVVQGVDIHQLEYKGQKVLTTKQLAELLTTTENALRNNFSRNKLQFQEGVHYIKLTGEELRAFSLSIADSDLQNIGSKARSFVLWTAKGSIAHVKITDSPKAWSIYHDMVKVYFGESPSLPERGVKALEITTKKAVQEFKAYTEAAKLFGLTGNNATLSANNAVEKRYGVNLMGQLGVTHIASVTQNVCLTPTQIGGMFGRSGQWANKVLMFHGYQEKKGKQWTPTERGESLSAMQDTVIGNGTPVKQLKWDESILDCVPEFKKA